MTILVNSVVSGGGDNDQMIISTHTAAELTALAAAGGLTPYATYIASDTGVEFKAKDESSFSSGQPMVRQIADPYGTHPPRRHELKGVHTQLLNPDTGHFGWGVAVGNGGSISADGIALGGSSFTGGIEADYQNGIPGMIERVDDSIWIGGSGELASTDQQSAWKFTCATTHKAISGSRTELAGFPLPLGRTYALDYRFRFDSAWDFGQETAQNAVLAQIHQDSGYGASQNASQPSISLQLLGSRLRCSVSVLDDLMGADQGAYFNWGAPGDQAVIYLDTAPVTGLRYYNVYMEFHLDHRPLSEGGQGFVRCYVDGQVICDYKGPTVWPTPESGVYVDPSCRVGIYMSGVVGAYTTDVTLNSARGMLATRSLFVRKAAYYSIGGV